MSKGWHILVEGASLTVARRVPVRWDLVARTRLPDGNRLAVAQQIRQDLWRALRDLRGFSPLVQVTRDEAGLEVRAGGQVDGRVPKTAAAVIDRLLAMPDLRRRWMAHA